MLDYETIENLTTRIEASGRGGGVEIDLHPLGYPEGALMSAYQNYLGGGMLGAVQGACNLKDWQDDEKLVEINEHLRRYFHGITNPDGDDWVDFDFEQNQSMPASAY
jgi:hypothetical protein